MSWEYAGDCPQCQAPRWAEHVPGERPGAVSYSCQCQDAKPEENTLPPPSVTEEVMECARKGGHVISPMRWPLPAPVNPSQAHVPYDAVRCLRRAMVNDGRGNMVSRRCNVTVVLEYGRHAPEKGNPPGVAEILMRERERPAEPEPRRREKSVA